MLAKFEPDCMVRKVQNFELFDKKPSPDHVLSWLMYTLIHITTCLTHTLHVLVNIWTLYTHTPTPTPTHTHTHPKSYEWTMRILFQDKNNLLWSCYPVSRSSPNVNSYCLYWYGTQRFWGWNLAWGRGWGPLGSRAYFCSESTKGQMSNVIQRSGCFGNALWSPKLIGRTSDQSVIHYWNQRSCRRQPGSTRCQIAHKYPMATKIDRKNPWLQSKPLLRFKFV